MRDIDPDLLSENAASKVFGAAGQAASKPAGGGISTGTKVGVTALGAGIATHNMVRTPDAKATKDEEVLPNIYPGLTWTSDIIPGIPYSCSDIAIDLGFVAAGVLVGLLGGPIGEAAALTANAARIGRVIKIIKAVWSKISFINPIEAIPKAGMPIKEFMTKIVHAYGNSAQWSVVTNTIFNLLADLGINVNVYDAYNKLVKEDGEMQPTQDQIRDPAFCAAHGIEPGIDPALEKDPAFIDVYVGARHFHKSTVMYKGKTYPVYLEADFDGPGAPSGFTISESADLARIKLLTHKLLNG